ncbi:MAG: hypothetical protein NVS9B1_19980 [Candidatus Dormibacteraceae bacterium]
MPPPALTSFATTAERSVGWAIAWAIVSPLNVKKIAYLAMSAPPNPLSAVVAGLSHRFNRHPLMTRGDFDSPLINDRQYLMDRDLIYPNRLVRTVADPRRAAGRKRSGR